MTVSRAHLPLRCLLFACLLCAWIAAGCDLPRDPDGTLARVQGGTLRVGIIEHPPWASVIEGAPPRGVEVELIKEFAAELNARPEWVGGGEQTHIEALKAGELDLVIGGLTAETPWSAEIGVTNPYFENRIVVGVRAGVTPPARLARAPVLVRRGTPTATHIEEAGGTPVRVDRLFRLGDAGIETLPVAAEEWELEARGYTPSKIELHTSEHVVAVAPGENEFLMRLERFLAARRSGVREMLKREGVLTETLP